MSGEPSGLSNETTLIIEMIVAGVAITIGFILYFLSKKPTNQRRKNIQSAISQQFNRTKESLEHHISRVNRYLTKDELQEHEYSMLTEINKIIYKTIENFRSISFMENFSDFSMSKLLLELDPKDKKIIDAVNEQITSNYYNYHKYENDWAMNIESENEYVDVVSKITEEKFKEELKKLLTENKRIHEDSLVKLNSISEKIKWIKISKNS